MSLIIQLLDYLTAYGSYAYVFMFVILLACGFGLPIPEDIILITGGILSARGVCDVYITFLVTFLGVMIGDGTVFSIGKMFGPKLKPTRFYKAILPPHREETVRGWFQKHGEKVIFFARFAPGLRTPLFMTAGMYRVPYWKFLAFDGFAALISVPFWIWLGFVFGSNLELLGKKIHEAQFGLYGVLALILVGMIGLFFLKKKRI